MAHYFRILLLLGLTATNLASDEIASAPFMVQSYASPISLNEPDLSSRKHNAVAFTNCQPDDKYKVYGEVDSITITPCHRSSSDQPCTFVQGRNYTIELCFTTQLDAPRPRSSLVANDTDGPYAYSGQSFDGCKYASCPIYANERSLYTYHFRTLGSNFNYLTFNVTQDFLGPSLFCAGTPIHFQAKKPS